MKQFLFVLLLLFAACNWAPEDPFDAFMIVDQSIDKSNAHLHNSIENIIDSLHDSEQKKLERFMQSKYGVTKLLDTLIYELEKKCTGEDDLNCATELLITENKSEEIITSFEKMREEGNKLLIHRDTTYDNYFKLFEGDAEKYFQQIPAIAATTILK